MEVKEYDIEGVFSRGPTMEFQAAVSNNTWLIKTTYAKGWYEVYGCDGSTIYSYLVDDRFGKNRTNYVPALVTEGEFPLTTSYYITLPWLAYASASYIRTHFTNGWVNIPALWSIPQSDPTAFILRCRVTLSEGSPAIPMTVDFFPDPAAMDRVRKGEVSTLSILSKSTWDLAILQLQLYDPQSTNPVAEYGVLSTREEFGLTLPWEFRLTRYWDKTTKLRTVFSGAAFKMEPVHDFSPRPTSERRMWVSDFRFRDAPVLLGFIQYSMTNSDWHPKDDPGLRQLFTTLQAKHHRAFGFAAWARSTVMVPLIVFFLLPLIVLAIRYEYSTQRWQRRSGLGNKPK
jgi:hypothetical protein